MRLGIDVERRFGCSNVGVEAFGDRQRGLFGERGDFIIVVIVAVSPKMGVGGHLDELHRHVDFTVCARDGTLNDAIDTECAGNLSQRLMRIF